MSNKDKLVIVVPVANEADTVCAFSDELLFYVSKLPFKSQIFFVVDDASIDNTRELLNQVCKKNKITRVIYDKSSKILLMLM